MTFIAYLDDSREKWAGAEFHAIAGYMAPAEFWEGAFPSRWVRLLRSGPYPISEFKTSDCRALKREFKRWSRAEASAFTRAVVDEVVTWGKEVPAMGVGTVAMMPQVEGSTTLALSLEALALSFCLINAMGALCSFARSVGRQERIEFVCDKQPQLEGRLRKLWSRVVNRAESWYGKDLSRLAFEDSRVRMPLQAADLLAYETRKDLKRRIEQPFRPRSKALHRLVNAYSHIGFYVDYDMMQEIERGAREGTTYFAPGILYHTPGLGINVRPPLPMVEDPNPAPPS